MLYMSYYPPYEQVWGMEPIILLFSLVVESPMHRESIQPLRFWLEVFRVVSWRRDSYVVFGGEPIYCVVAEDWFQMCKGMFLDRVCEGVIYYYF